MSKPSDTHNNRGERRKQPPAILFRLDYDSRKHFKIAAANLEVTLQDALLEAANDWMDKNDFVPSLTFTPDLVSYPDDDKRNDTVVAEEEQVFEFVRKVTTRKSDARIR